MSELNPTVKGPDLPASDHRVAWGPDPRHVGDLRLPAGAGPHPVVVVIHGGCWRDIAGPEYMVGLAGELRRQGYATWSVTYRRLGDEGGGWPNTLLDLAAAVDQVRSLARVHPLDTGRVVTLGHSAGGHLALWAAGRHRIPAESVLHVPEPLRVRGAVSLAGIGDLGTFHARDPSTRACGEAVSELLGDEPRAVPDRLAAASPAELLPLGVPQLLLTGADDPDVPADLVERYARKVRAAGDEVVEHVVPDAGHFEVVTPMSPRWSAVWSALGPFLERVLGG